MKSVFMVVAVMAVILCGLCSQALASNPADPTSDFRYSGDFAKVAWDGGPWFGVVIKEVGNRMSVLALHWEDAEGECKLNELAVTKQFDTARGTLEVGLFLDDFNSDDPSRIGAMVDWTNGKVGIGAILPTTDHPAKGELRYNAGKVTFNLAFAEAGCSTANYGIGITSGTTRLELAYGDSTWYFRACKPQGKFFPELRTKFGSGETVIGFGIGFAG